MNNILILAEPVEGAGLRSVHADHQQIPRAGGHNARCLTGRVFKERVESLGAAILPLSALWDAGSQVSGLRFFSHNKVTDRTCSINLYIRHFMYAQVSDILNALESVFKDFKANAIIEVTFRVAGTWLRELGSPPSVRLSVLPLSLLGKDIAPFEMGLSSGTSYFSKLCNNLLNVLLLFKDGQPMSLSCGNQWGCHPMKNIFLSAQ